VELKRRLGAQRARVGAVTTPLADLAEQGAHRLGRRFRSPLHDEWVASVLGVSLGIAFTVCFLTGLVDYLAQHPPHWFHLPVRPVNFYRVTQGTHVITGIATIPLLLAKLWTVWPKLFSWPPVHNPAHALERLSLIPLVGGSLFLLFTGVANIAYWYSPMPFFFPTAHFWTAWVVVGAMVIHIGSKSVVARSALARGPAETGSPVQSTTADQAGTPSAPLFREGLSRRGFVATVVGSGAVLILTVAGETVAPLRRLALLAPRNPVVGPQSLPVNQSAIEAGVTTSALDPAFQLEVTGNCRHPRTFTLAELRSLPQRAAGLPITCVEGWSAAASWRGISLPWLLNLVGARPQAAVRVESLESSHRLYSSSVIDPQHAADPDTLLALELNDAPLDIDHGYPLRLIAPDRPGVLQTKWVTKVVVL
jgi:DMSO/TMAO reductase YedYZ molybdopterin-dependent catalytic subunit